MYIVLGVYLRLAVYTVLKDIHLPGGILYSGIESCMAVYTGILY